MDEKKRQSGSEMLFQACIVLALLSIAVCAIGVVKILGTTPFMGIPVDANGNRLPIEGYPEFWFGLAGACVFATVALGIYLTVYTE